MSASNRFYPATLAGLWRQMRAEQGEAALLPLRRRLLGWQIRLAAVERVRGICLISLEPLVVAGLWAGELAEIAGVDLELSQKGMPPAQITIEALEAADPDLLLLALPGQSLSESVQKAWLWQHNPAVQALRCIKNKRFYCLDGSRLLHYPGAALALSVEVLADLLHPSLKLGHAQHYWQHV